MCTDHCTEAAANTIPFNPQLSQRLGGAKGFEKEKVATFFHTDHCHANTIPFNGKFSQTLLIAVWAPKGFKKHNNKEKRRGIKETKEDVTYFPVYRQLHCSHVKSYLLPIHTLFSQKVAVQDLQL